MLGAGANLFGLARTDEVLRIRPRTRRQHSAHRERPRRGGQRRKFGGIVGIHRVPDAHADQHGALTTPRAFKQLQSAAYSFDDRRFRHFAVLAGRQPHIARGHDGGNGMFVHHLTDAISEQDDELVE